MVPKNDNCPELFQPNGNLRGELLAFNSRRALREAMRLTRETQWDCVRSPHVFMGLLVKPDPVIYDWGLRLEVDLDDVLLMFLDLFYQEHGEHGAYLALHREFLSDNVIRTLRYALLRALDYQRREITPMDLLMTVLEDDNIVVECIERLGLAIPQLTELALLAELSITDPELDLPK